jgi:hypothetical protein
MRKSLIGQEARRHSGCQWKVVRDVIISPYRNAYTIIFVDGSECDMSTYCSFETR